jgi:hypothetical protein
MGLVLLILRIEVVIYCDIYPPLVFCKAIFLKVVKVVYLYRLVYVLILKAFSWQLSHSIPLGLCMGLRPGGALRGSG